MPHTQTTIYVNTNTNPHQGITPADIGAVLVRSTQDTGQLCGDVNANGEVVNGGNGAINKWAKYKPQRIPQHNEITDSQRALYDYGFDTSSNDNSIVAKGDSTAVSNLMTRAIRNGGGWVYLRPRGTNYNEPYRVLDFNGYHHNAVCPYEPVSRGVSGDSSLLPSSINVIKRVDAEIPFQSMRAFLAYDVDYDPSDFYIGVITRKAGVTKLFINSSVTMQDIIDEEEATAENTEWSVPVTFDQTDGTTTCLFVFTTIHDFDSPGVIDDSAGDIQDQITIWLPDCMAIYTISSVTNTILLAPGHDYFFTLHTDGSGDSLQRITPQVFLTNGNSGATQSVAITVAMQYYDSSGETWVDITSSTSTQTIPNGGTVNLTMPDITMPSAVQEIDNFSRSYLRVKVTWTWTYNYTSHTRYFDFANGYPVSVDPGFTTIANVISDGYVVITERA